MSSRVDLVLLGDHQRGRWDHGERVLVPTPTPAAVAQAVERHLADHRPDALLHWDPALGEAPEDCLTLLDEPDHAWHGGLALGLRGLPRSIDLIAPTWMLNADPPPDRAATSWRLSLRACLVRAEVVRHLGAVDPSFVSLAGAGLELGHRWLAHGARIRYEPRLVPGRDDGPAEVPAEDDQRFALRRYGRRWAVYAALRSPGRAKGLRRVRRVASEPVPPTGSLPPPAAHLPERPPSVSVVIPTIDRYPWLTTVLDQLAGQTVAPLEVLVADQTPDERREVVAAPGGLVVRVLRPDGVGQSRARNLAIERAGGEALLFLDDDDEIGPDLVERHVARLATSRADACSGVAHEPGAQEPDPSFLRFRASDVFPTNNSMLRRRALDGSGLFDLAYDHGERADHDLGMRLYLGGARLVLDPAIEVDHLHAPRGGLRTHAARVQTYRGSRHSTVARHHLAPTEVYLWRRYYRPDQVREAVRLRLLGTFSRRGGPLARAARVGVQLVLLPDTLRRVRRAQRDAGALAAHHPTIPTPVGAERAP